MRMLYKYPGKHILHGIACDYTLVADETSVIVAAEADGWYRSPAEAKEQVVIEPVTLADLPAMVDEKAELKKQAEALGIEVDGRWSIARLKQEIDNADQA